MLLARPQQQASECAVGYLIRVSEKNGFSHLGHLLSYAGLPWKNSRAPVHSILSGSFNLEPYTNFLGLPAVNVPTSITYSSFKKIVDTSNILVRTPKICPDCISEQGYCESKWAFLPIVACGIHNRLLVDTETGSCKRLSWYRRELDGNPLKIKYSSDVSETSELAIEVSSFFECLLFDGLNNAESILAGLEFREGLSVLNFICHYQSKLRGERFNPVTLENKLLGEAYCNAWNLLRSWPDAFHDLLDEFKKAPMAKRGVSGVNKHFRDLSEALYRQRKNKGIALLRAEFDRYLQKRWPGYINSDKTIRINVDDSSRDIITRKAAAVILNCRPVLIDKYVKQNRLTVSEFKGGKYYSRSEVSKLAELISSNWTMNQASDELCLSPYQLRQLLKAGVIPIIQRPDELNRDWIIDKKKCQALILKLRGNAHNAPIQDGLSMSGIQKNGFSIVKLFQGMRDGSISYCVEDNNKVAAGFKQFVQFKYNQA